MEIQQKAKAGTNVLFGEWLIQKEIISHLHKEFITKIVMGVIFIIAGVFFLTRHLLLA